MKYLLISLSLIFYIACNKSEESCLNNVKKKLGISTCESNLQNWGEAQMSFVNGSDKESFVISSDKWSDECDNYYTSFQYIPNIIGRHSLLSSGLGRPECNFILLNGGDAIVNRWDLDTTKQNWITITSISKDTAEISGKFDLSFILRPSSKGKFYSHLPDSLYLRDGEFTAKLIE